MRRHHRERFIACRYGPSALRGTLRRRLLRDETIARWWVGRRAGSSWASALRWCTLALPGSTALAFDELATRSTCLVIETERRILVLGGEDPGRVVLEEPRHRVKMEEKGRRVALRAGARELRLRRIWSGRSRHLSAI